ncbi:PadR family transcriptional regulator [Devosia sp. BSSL-BM10]|uniref:PadR family transcriptional regulator n=1 Tax=Devosia litorisediminis TaxID=2829817 RepID=A0A942E6H2_9HYPH|nr:PadR family transcriptional regulator [Devosia litorisediminis]MBS3849048.1 PadR family transcriptional regulator [Devosia litorisediminis]
MNVRTLCLSILFEGEATGYEIRRLCVEGECSYFIEASFGSIYPALARLEENGFVVSRTEQQDGKPAKKVYSITEAGRTEFRQQLAEPLGEDVFRSPFLLFARYAHILPRGLVEARVTEYLRRATEDRKKLEEIRSERSCNAAESWVMEYGRAMMEVAERHTRTHMHELITMARAEPEKDAAE